MDDHPKASKTEGRDDKYRRESKARASDFAPIVDESIKSGMEGEGEIKPPAEHNNGHHRAQQAQVQKGEDRNRAPRAPMDGLYPDEGPSNHHRNPRYRYSDGERDGTQNKASYHDQGQEELLRLLDELRDQVQRTCEVTDKPNATAPPVNRMATSTSYGHRGAWFHESSALLNRNASQRSSYLSAQNINRPNFHSTLPAQNDVPGYEQPVTHGRASFHPPGHYPQTRRQFDTCPYGQFDPDPVIPCRHDDFYHRPACSCPHCYHRQFSLPLQCPAAIFGHQEAPYHANNQGFYPMDGPSIFGGRYNSRVANAPLHSCESQTLPRTIFSKKVGRSCHPIAGAAPFAVCYNCFELLQLPKKSLLVEKSQFKLRCGSCSKVVSVKLDGSRLVASFPAPNSHASSVNNNASSSDGVHSMGEKILLPYSVDVSDHGLEEKENGLNFSDPEKMQGISSSSSMSGHVESPESVISPEDVPSSAEIPLEAAATSHVPSVPLREHFGCSLSDQVVDGPGKGSRSQRSDQERSISLSGNFKQKSVKDVPVATELDLSSGEYPTAGLSQDSWDMKSKEEVQPKVVKGGDTFLAGFIKKSFRDFSRFNQSLGHGRAKVSINGHPIPDRLVKKAEKLAGPVYPGDYWYDYRAGFWGVMGNKCVGIIPPFIEEFNYPMPKNCAGGNTAVLVNGRELHQKDLDLLAGRGLPTAAGQSYIIEISGKVWDESSGEELDSLGKLAPT
ncbi:protein ENHANCED DISEASE RESISTANCE 4 [Cocos nucifera]|uniref:Protein ENHANCED DISEASE RESISTANCE 4 n=1 Tax=Cocos nucifera TaxID=13894 RepID=A0A8K0I4K6_COCNU|nr:protein ENHANCED DISEASE RESISTANCE 4 [Cocos nucifera]